MGEEKDREREREREGQMQRERKMEGRREIYKLMNFKSKGKMK